MANIHGVVTKLTYGKGHHVTEYRLYRFHWAFPLLNDSREIYIC